PDGLTPPDPRPGPPRPAARSSIAAVPAAHGRPEDAPESPLTTRLPPPNEIGVIPADSSVQGPQPAARPSRPGTIAPSSARLPGRTGRNPDRADDRRCAAQRRSGMADGRIR